MIEDILLKAEKMMKTSVGVLSKELDGVRTGRATPSLVDHVTVEYAGVPTPLNQLAGISAQGARLLVIQPWDKTAINAIQKAIMTSDMGLNPSSDGNVIRINIPPLSEERRQELIKVSRGKAEKERVVMRNQRRDAIDEVKKLEKQKKISQDDLKRAMDKLQKITDRFIAEATKVEKAKEAELQEI